MNAAGEPEPRKLDAPPQVDGRADVATVGALRTVCIVAAVAFLCHLYGGRFPDGSLSAPYIGAMLTVVGGMLAVLLATHARAALAHVAELAAIALMISTSGVLALAALSARGISRHHEALVIVFLAFSLMAAWRPRTAALLYGGLVVLYNMVLVATGRTGPVELWLANNIVLCTCIAVCVLSIANSRRLRAQEQVARAGLEQNAAELRETSERLALTIEKLREVSSHKSDFMSNVSHELRTPLTLILAPLESMLADPLMEPYPALRERMRMMRRNAARLLRLINGLLDFAKLDAGRMKVFAEAVHLGPYLADLTSTFDELAQRKGITLSLVDVTDEIVLADTEKLETILHNVIANALKFTPKDGKVDISAGCTDEQVWIEVRDTGVGIAKEFQAAVFERFVQSEDAVRNHLAGSGTGIGLALSRELAQLQGGDLTLESVRGQGTRVRLALPLLPVTASEATSAFVGHEAPRRSRVETSCQWYEERSESDTVLTVEEPPSDYRGPALGRVLVVEDEADMRQLLREILAPRYEVAVAEDGEEGLERAIALKPDVIVSDVVMPHMSGYGLTRALKANQLTRDIPVILLTAKRDIDSTLEGFAHGADDKLSKPFHPNELLARVQARVELKHLQDSLRGQIERLEYLARIDATTGIANRRYMFEALQRLVDGATRRRSMVAFILADVDHFKEVNDTFGHGAGDQALRLVTTTMQECLRTQDLLGRYGGEEFGVVLPDTDLAGAMILAERCRRAVESRTLELEAGHVQLTISLGVAVLTPGVIDAAELVRRADAALYAAKRAGRNRSLSAVAEEGLSVVSEVPMGLVAAPSDEAPAPPVRHEEVVFLSWSDTEPEPVPVPDLRSGGLGYG